MLLVACWVQKCCFQRLCGCQKLALAVQRENSVTLSLQGHISFLYKTGDEQSALTYICLYQWHCLLRTSLHSSAVGTNQRALRTCYEISPQNFWPPYVPCVNLRALPQSSSAARQASKEDPEQPSIAAVLPPLDPSGAALDVCVVGCGPSGLALAAELGALGVRVGLVGMKPTLSKFSALMKAFIDAVICLLCCGP